MFNVYIPSTELSNLGIKKGSAIVSKQKHYAQGLVEIWYEGNLYNACNLESFEDKCTVAAFRCRDKASTVAKSVVPANKLECIGTFDLNTKKFIANTSHCNRMADWLNSDKRETL